MTRCALQQRAEGQLIGRVEAAQRDGFDAGQLALHTMQGCRAGFGDDDPPGPPVRGVRLALDQPGLLEVVEQVREHRAVDAQLVRECQLGGGALVGRAGQDVIPARAAGQFSEDGLSRAQVGAQQQAQRETQI
jgi:hypothetical protein